MQGRIKMSRLVDDIRSALKSYPGLQIDKASNAVKGGFNIRNTQTNEVLETYELEITFPQNYPGRRLPIVRECSNKIPRNRDRHIFEDGRLCLSTALGELLICRRGITFEIFLNEILYPFLATQFAMSCGWLNEFPQGEYGHGARGIYESYAEFLGIGGEDAIVLAIRMAMMRNQRNKKCFCGSGRKLKDCHRQSHEILKKIGKDQLEQDAYLILTNKTPL